MICLLPAVLSPELPTGNEGEEATCWPIGVQIISHMRPDEDTVMLVV
jgi:hypothetical protein